MRNLSGKRVLITGAAGGLGRELALAFTAADTEVVVTDINEAGIQQTVELVRVAGGRVIAMTMDVTDEESVLRARKELHQKHGRIDILVNNAGIVRSGAFLDVPLKAHRNTFLVNTIGPLIVTHVFLPDLIAQPEGRCINVISASGMIPLPNGTTYAASKWGALGLSDSIREELRCAGHHHVGVTAVCPGLLDTDLFAGTRQIRLMPRLNAARLAARIVRTAQADKAYLLTPWLTKLIPLGKAIIPLSIGQWVFDRLGVTKMYDLTNPLPHRPMQRTTHKALPTHDRSLPECAVEPPVSN